MSTAPSSGWDNVPRGYPQGDDGSGGRLPVQPAGRPDEVADLRRQLDGLKNMDVETLKETLRGAIRQGHVW